MDWQVFFSTFALIFLAELGDKTQLGAIALSAGSKSTWSVLMGVILALATAGVLGVLAGKYLSEFLNPQYIKWTSGSLFLGAGLWILFGK